MFSPPPWFPASRGYILECRQPPAPTSSPFTPWGRWQLATEANRSSPFARGRPQNSAASLLDPCGRPLNGLGTFCVVPYHSLHPQQRIFQHRELIARPGKQNVLFLSGTLRTTVNSKPRPRSRMYFHNFVRVRKMLAGDELRSKCKREKRHQKHKATNRKRKERIWISTQLKNGQRT